MKRRRIPFLTLTLVTLLLLSACGQEDASTPELPNNSPLTTPSSEPFSSPLPTSQPDLATVSGVLINNLFEDPLAGRTIYLATIITSNDGLMEMARFDITTAPQAITDENGQFTFTNVEPGRYGAILGGAINDYLLADFRTQEEVVFTLEPNQVLDLGEIWITPPEG